MTIKEKISQELEEIRQEQNLNISEFAKQIKIDRKSLYNGISSVSVLEKIANNLNMELEVSFVPKQKSKK